MIQLSEVYTDIMKAGDKSTSMHLQIDNWCEVRASGGIPASKFCKMVHSEPQYLPKIIISNVLFSESCG